MQDDKEYKAVLEVLDVTGGTTPLLNKLGKLAISGNDPYIRESSHYISNYIRSTPAWTSVIKKFRVLSSINWDHYKHLPDYQEYRRVVQALHKYCQDCVNAQLPQWQIVARQHGWGPLQPLSPIR
ncbi:hypothetical protein [Rugamonas rivuli]|uniref:hypothetical protein n=1 Tax=Rugamonas rivuli TaxID=2743358 RepID=UPI0015828809|nr:hypothetical protein [Rugamonas rivuli]